MKKFLIGFFLIAMAFSLIMGCAAKESEDDTKMPADTKAAEAMDSTSMDSAMMTNTSDTTMMNEESGE